MQHIIICTLLLSFIYYVSCQVTCTQQHVIVEGDTCFAIASANNIDVQLLMKINPDVDCSRLQIGDPICIQGSVPTVTCTMSHTIVSGDTCFDIASANGLDVDTLKQLNSGIDCSSLQVGAVICVAGSAKSATPVQAPTAPPAPTVASPSIGTPVSVAPSSVAPTSSAPTSATPSSASPSSTVPATSAPSVQPTTASPSTSAPSSAAPTTQPRSSSSPSSSAPSSASPTSSTPEPTVRTPNSSKPSDISGNNNARASDASQTQFLLTLFVACLAMIL